MNMNGVSLILPRMITYSYRSVNHVNCDRVIAIGDGSFFIIANAEAFTCQDRQNQRERV